MLPMAAGQIGHPIAMFVEMVSDNGLIHGRCLRVIEGREDRLNSLASKWFTRYMPIDISTAIFQQLQEYPV